LNNILAILMTCSDGRKSLGSDRDLCVCRDAQPHGTNPRGATTTALARRAHAWSIKEHKNGVNLELHLIAAIYTLLTSKLPDELD